ncbi:MAG: YafY family protein, partial [Chitinophagaceae bacterium]
RLSRLTAILLLLQSKRLVTASTIAEKFGISKRTSYRDIRALEEAGVPILTEEGKGYYLMEGYSLPPVMFSETEANALITAELLVNTNKDASFVKNYSAAITKIKAVLKYHTKNKAELLSERIQFRINPTKETTSNYLSLIQLAITNSRVTDIKYSSELNESTTRKIEPLALYSTRENWILIANCRLRKEKRAFRLDRIEDLIMLDETFDADGFTLHQYFKECKSAYFSNTLDTGLSF